jgi:hypothetical protein
MVVMLSNACSQPTEISLSNYSICTTVMFQEFWHRISCLELNAKIINIISSIIIPCLWVTLDSSTQDKFKDSIKKLKFQGTLSSPLVAHMEPKTRPLTALNICSE